LNCYVVESYCAHHIPLCPNFHDYLQLYNVSGLLFALTHGRSQADIDRLFATLTDAQLKNLKTVIATFLASLSSGLDADSLKRLRSLPLLETEHGGKRKTSYDSKLFVAPKIFADLLKIDANVAQGPFLTNCHGNDIKLAWAMKFASLRDEPFFLRLLDLIRSPSFPSASRETLITYILNNLQSANFSELEKVIREHKFVPTTASADGVSQWRSPRELFHPAKCPEAPSLLNDPYCHPAPFLTKTLGPLSHLGLKFLFSVQELCHVVDVVSAQPSTGMPQIF